MYKLNNSKAQNKQFGNFLFHWAENNSESPYLLFIPGGYHGAICFENYFKYFSELGYNIASIDIPGRGGMEQGQDFLNLSIHHITDVIIKALSYSNITNFIIIGHSIGGLIGAMVACNSDSKGLVLLTPSPPGQLEGVLKVPVADKTKPNTMSIEKATERFWRHITDNKLIQELYNQIVPESPGILNERYELSINVPWQESKCPALLIEVELDNKERHPPMQNKKVANFFQADYIFMENMGHCMMAGDNWGKSAEIIKNWLKN